MSNSDQLKQLFGIDKSELETHIDDPDYPEVVPGRVLHIDGDFLAYQVSADDEKSLTDMMHNHDVAMETLRLLAGAESACLHLTASEGDKGERYDIAIQQEYQANRKDKVKPKHLYTIKGWMEQHHGAINHVEQEADDGLCQANYSAVKSGKPDTSVLCSMDKDLQMCPGWHLHWEDGTLEFVDGYGYVNLDRSKSSPKIVGKGTAYFWSQMLTGDGADSIKGIPKVPGSLLNKVKPTKAIEKAMHDLQHGTAKQVDKAKKTLADRKPGACGPVIAAELMKMVKSDKQAFDLIKTVYKAYGEDTGFTHWKTGEPVDWHKVLVSEAQLLWMRRVPDRKDVLHFFKEIG